MGESRGLKNFLYVEKIKLGIIISLLGVIYIWQSLVFKNDEIISIYIIKLIMVISSFCVILVLWGTKEFERDRFFDFIGNIYFVIIISNFPAFAIKMNYLSNINELPDILKKQSLIFLILYSICVRNLFKYIEFKDVKIRNKFFEIIILCVSMFFLMKFKLSNSVMQVIIFICFLISIKNIISISKYKLFLGNKVNYIYIFAILISIKLIYQLLIIILDLEIGLIFYSGIINFVNINTLAIIITDKLLNDPYNLLFGELFNRIEGLNKINEEILNKNKELELSQNGLRKSEELTKTLLKNLPLPLAIVSFESKRIIYANGLFLKLLNKKFLRDIINNQIFDYFDVDNKEMFEGKSDIRLSRCYLKGSNEYKHLTIEVIDINIENGEIILSLIDVTSKIQFDEIKGNIKENEFRQNIRRDFLSNVSHDLKTPINVIYSAMQLEPMFIKNNDKDSLLKYTRISRKNCDSLTTLANNIIDIGKINFEYMDITMKDIEFVSFVEDIVQSLIYYANEKKIELLFDTNVEELYFAIDKSAMNRIIINLISNSIKFTNSRGRILVQIDDSIEEVRLIVKDNGIGMSENVLRNIFRRYNTEGNNKKMIEKGSGIGLHVVKNLVEMQGGTIKIYSKKTEGTKVCMVFKKEGVYDRRGKEII